MAVTAGLGVATHALVWVEGPDAIGFLDSQLTQDVAGMPPGAVSRSMLLEPKGKLRGILWVLRDGKRVGLITDADDAERVVDDLARFKFRVKAETRRDERPVHSVWGSDPAPGGWNDDGLRLDATTPLYRLVAAHDVSGWQVLDAEVVRANRIASGEPRFGVDVDDATIPQETGLVPESVSFTKGCYLGQELVARIDSRGHVNRVLRRLEGRGAPPESGSTVAQRGNTVGSVGSVAWVGGGWMALALLRREVEPGSEVMIGNGAGAMVFAAKGDPAATSQSSNATPPR